MSLELFRASFGYNKGISLWKGRIRKIATKSCVTGLTMFGKQILNGGSDQANDPEMGNILTFSSVIGICIPVEVVGA